MSCASCPILQASLAMVNPCASSTTPLPKIADCPGRSPQDRSAYPVITEIISPIVHHIVVFWLLASWTPIHSKIKYRHSPLIVNTPLGGLALVHGVHIGHAHQVATRRFQHPTFGTQLLADSGSN